MIPARVALALQADGWWLRSDIIWSKRNTSPESVRDRPSKSHEYIFLLTKSSRYFYDQEPLREPVLPESLEREKYGWNEAFVGRHQGSPREKRLRSDDHNGFTSPTGRNCRSVWEMATQACPVPHLAAFPEELPERCIKAGTSLKGCCPKCGAPWERILERTRPDDWEDSGPVTDREKELRAISQDLYGGNQKSRSISDIYGRATNSKIETKEWLPTCSCGVTELAPCVVLDPFAGSGTTGQVAKKLGRSCILIELNPDYDDMIRIRTGVGVERGPLDISLEEKVKEDAVENQNR